MKRYFPIIFLIFLIITGCGTPEGENNEVENSVTPPVEQQEDDLNTNDEELPTVDEEEIAKELTVLATNLEIPWAIEKYEDIIYLTERPGSIVKIENEITTRQEVVLEHEVSTEEEAGLMGFVLDPNFSENRQALAYYTYSGSSGPTNRIAVLQNEEDVWTEVAIILDNIPSGVFHHGGRLKIGPDEKLYATTGDALNSDLAQDLNSLAGKILRMNLDGSIPSDNPNADSYIYSYGHRNAQGLTWVADDRMYASEHGNQANDEINEIQAGGNYGWRIIEGMQEQEGLITPIFTSGPNETWAPSGMDSFENKLYVAGLRGNAVYEFNLETNEMSEKLTEHGRIRDVYIEGEYLYFITNNTDGRGNQIAEDDQLFRISLK